MDNKSSVDDKLSERWMWFLYVLFGMIAVQGFKTIESEIWNLWEISPGYGLLFIYVTVCLFAFFLYDIGVLQVLVYKFPYRISPLSTFRYILDIFMAFLIFLMFKSGMGVLFNIVNISFSTQSTLPDKSSVWQYNNFLLIAAIVLWHFCAASWHYLAAKEDHSETVTKTAFLSHFSIASIYPILLIIRASASSLFPKIDASPSSLKNMAVCPYLLSAVSSIIIISSIVRWNQVVKGVRNSISNNSELSK